MLFRSVKFTVIDCWKELKTKEAKKKYKRKKEKKAQACLLFSGSVCCFGTSVLFSVLVYCFEVCLLFQSCLLFLNQFSVYCFGLLFFVLVHCFIGNSVVCVVTNPNQYNFVTEHLIDLLAIRITTCIAS